MVEDLIATDNVIDTSTYEGKVEWLIDKYGGSLEDVSSPLTIDSIPNFTSLASADAFIQLMMDSLESGRLAPPMEPVVDVSQNCTGAGNYRVSGISAGLFSSFRGNFSYNGSSVTSFNIVATGIMIGWSWSQTSFTASGLSGCVGGQVTWGVGVGPFTVGIPLSYHINFSFNPYACTVTTSQGYGGC